MNKKIKILSVLLMVVFSLFYLGGISNAASSALVEDLKIDINQANAADLTKVPGVGKVMAERIVEYREKNGGFKTLEEVMNVKGIAKKKFEKIKNYLVLQDEIESVKN